MNNFDAGLFSATQKHVVTWAHERNIISYSPVELNHWPQGGGTLEGQAGKTVEEATEFLEAVQAEDIDAVIDGIGDTLVTLIIACAGQNLDLADCLQAAWKEIEHRTGKMVDGVFVKNA